MYNAVLTPALTPDAPFKPGEMIRITVSSGLAAAGDAAPLTPYTWQFRAAAPAGQGRFSRGQGGLGDSSSFDVALGDLDNDGDLDAVVVNAGDLGPATYQRNQVWLNGKDGDLGAFSGESGFGNNVSTAVALGDVDRDGDLDAVFGNLGLNEIWLNQGGAQGGPAGQFKRGQYFGSTASYGLALGDLDGQGALAIFTANAEGETGRPNEVWFNRDPGWRVYLPLIYKNSNNTPSSAPAPLTALYITSINTKVDYALLKHPDTGELLEGEGCGTIEPGDAPFINKAPTTKYCTDFRPTNDGTYTIIVAGLECGSIQGTFDDALGKPIFRTVVCE